VLVVDDDEDSLAIFCTTLESQGLRALGASTGDEAVTATRGTHPDLVVLDLVLQGEDGWSVLQRLRGEQGMGAVPFLVVTAASSPENRERALQHASLRYMEKPLPPRAFAAAVAEMLRDA
jgi:DNA-binding response OmpR family regulator